MNESSRMGLVGSQAILDGQRRAEDTFVGLGNSTQSRNLTLGVPNTESISVGGS